MKINTNKLYIYIYILSTILHSHIIHAQEVHYCYADTTNISQRSNYQSWLGYYHQLPSSNAAIKPTGTYRILNIFVNIHYDQAALLDPAINSNSNWWPATNHQGINNQSIPTYLSDFMDVEYNPANVHGMLTRVFHESSFGSLVLLGDFMVVNINQSYITPNNPGSNFTQTTLINKVFSLINENGGLSTINGNNSLIDYDSDADGNIDMVQFLLRNVRNDSTANFGGVNSGSGNITNKRPYNLIINGQLTSQESVFSYQGVGTNRTYTLNPTGIVTHEFAHALFGGNTFHTSGGNHYGWGQTNTWFGLEGGYGLMGASGTGLVSCNGYERWRMHWTSPVYNPEGILIQANEIDADISKEDGPKTFVLRDFVTTGDAIRIKLPYVDENASNQYIWLENHQIGNNNKLDYLQYALYSNLTEWHECRPLGAPGIYSYIQVGKDILDSTSTYVYPTNETDNLRIISAEGNWDFIKLPDELSACVNSDLSRTVMRFMPNPLSGYQDQTTQFFDTIHTQNKLHGDNGARPRVKYDHNGQLISNHLAGSGDELDAFTGNSQMSIGTNPSPANLTTYYVSQQGGNFTVSNTNTNTSHIYLTGLRIDMTENQDGSYQVDIVWDDYEVKNDIRWAGNIVLKEKVILKEGKTIELDQSLTPNQISRDPVSGVFAKPTVFRCEEGSEFILEQESELVLKNLSTLILESGSRFEIGDHAILTVNEGDTLKIEPCARLVIKGNGLLNIKEGGVLCISEGAIIATDKGHYNLMIHNNAVIPYGCIDPFDIVPSTTAITGTSFWFNKVFHANTITIYEGGSLTIASSDVLFADSGSKIIIKKGGKLTVTSNSRLTNSCGDYWRGIYVEGDRDSTQTFEKQGALILQNGAIIENAKDAVMLKGADNDWAYTGGIIQATDATFRNNWRNVEFMSYQNTNTQGQPIDNISYFTNCTFTTDDETLHDTHTANVTMWNVTGVRFTNCTFTDERDNVDYYGYRTSRDGIYTKEATFRVWGSEFNHMKFGIHSIATIPDRYFSVYLSEFSSFKGIYFNAKDNVIIMDNTFHVAPGYTYPGSKCGDTYGIYINNSSNFKIENNQLFSTSNGATMCGSLGIIARNTGSYTNEIYRNDLEGFTVGIEAIGENKGQQNYKGLELKCNRNLENAFDIFVTKDGLYRNTGIRELQGYSATPTTSTLAGNIFGNNSSILVANFVNNEDHISYFHHDPFHPNSESEDVVPAVHYGEITFWKSIYPYIYENSCPKNPLLIPLAQLQEERNESMALFTETEILLESHIDDGNTELMTQQVEMAGDGDTYTTYQYMMQTSPFLSEEVLTALSAKEDGFNKAMIRDVLVENPQSAKSEDVNLALDNRQDPLPAYMRWQINNGLYHFSEMEVMRHFMAYQKTRHDRALNRILGGIIRNEEGFENAPPVEEILAGVDDIRYQYMLAEWHFGKGNFYQGMQLLDQIEQDYDLSEEALWNAHEDKLGFYNWLSQWNQEEHPGYTQLPEDALQELENYLDATPRIAGKALSLLVLNEAIEYEEPILYPDVVLKSEPAHQQTMPLIPEMDEEFTFRLYPNPSREYITLNWCFDSSKMKGVIEIRNTTGVLLDKVQVGNQCDQQIYPLTQLRSGTYTATLVSGNHIRKSLSFVVIK